MAINKVGSKGIEDCSVATADFAPGTVTSSTAEVLWNGIWSNSTGLNIYYDTQVSPSGWTLANSTPIVTTVSNYKIENLVASTAYKVKVVDAGNSAACKPIEILFSTLAA